MGRERAISEMDQSKLDAVAAVLRRLTDYPREHGEGGARGGRRARGARPTASCTRAT
ncbi:MAG: hypothetical protein KatS3mg014_0233 [Actinomycetota bacterium]|nr:MAG: hypothetical protein KatS3mg014_0233 [Actinomycetota bacterium]